MTMPCPPETDTTLHPVGHPLMRSKSMRMGRHGGKTSDSGGNHLFGLTRPSNKGRGREGPTSIGGRSDGTGSLGRVSSTNTLSSAVARQNAPPPPRAFSDTALIMSRSSSSSSAPYLDPLKNLPRTNATFSLVQRSGAPLIRQIVASIDCKIEAATATTNGCAINSGGAMSASGTNDTPRAELTALANCTRGDAYYRVIASASGGIPSVVRAMHAFQDDEETQASGCAALASICVKNASNQVAAGQGGALRAVLTAMARFPISIAVQGAGCDALDALTGMTPRNVELLKRDEERNYEEILEGALGRFLPPSCREGAQAVLRRAAALCDDTQSMSY